MAGQLLGGYGTIAELPILLHSVACFLYEITLQSHPETQHSSDRGSIPSLDGLRAISISIVLVSHAGYGNVVPGGLGVTIFFFLSGYLITTLLMNERERSGRIDFGKFYRRRVFRLFPALPRSLAIAFS